MESSVGERRELPVALLLLATGGGGRSFISSGRSAKPVAERARARVARDLLPAPRACALAAGKEGGRGELGTGSEGSFPPPSPLLPPYTLAVLR